MTVVIEELHEGHGHVPSDSGSCGDLATSDSVSRPATTTIELRREVARLRDQMLDIGIDPDSGLDLPFESEAAQHSSMDDLHDDMILSQEPHLSDQTLEYETGDKYQGETRGAVRHGFGTHTCPNGDVYQGHWRLDKRHGEGKMTFKSGLKYDGEWMDDKACGQGTCIYENGNVYKGEWRNDHRSGWGQLNMSSGERYEGEWLEDQMEGMGQFVEADGSVFEGQHTKNSRVKGKWVSSDGAVEYNGDWKGLSWNGQGVMHDSHKGLQYKGSWADDLMQGEGCCRYSDGAAYEGNWAAGLREGNGKLIFADGTKYIGSFHQDLREGFGSCEYATGERYCGGWKQGQRHGKGRSTTHDGDKYEGEWMHDKRNGDGICLYNNGDKYEGSWKDGLRHGYGTCLFADGTLFRGEWEEDHWVQSSAEPGKCKMAGPGISRAIAGHSATVFIEAFDEDGNRRLCGGDDFRCVLVGADTERIHGKVIDHGDGKYTVEYVATVAGRYQLHCTIGAQEEVEESPYPVLVLPSLPSLKHCRVSGDGRSAAAVGQTACFNVEAMDEYGNATSASLIEALPIEVFMSSGGIECPVTVTARSAAGLYVCSYTAKVVGFYRIEVLSGKRHFPGSPYSVEVRDPAAQRNDNTNRPDAPSGNTSKEEGQPDSQDEAPSGEAAGAGGSSEVKDLSSHWMTIAASAFGQDGCMDGWDSDPEDKTNDDIDYSKTHPGVPVIENLEDMWQLSKLQRERKQHEQKEKAARLAKLKKQLESRFGQPTADAGSAREGAARNPGLAGQSTPVAPNGPPQAAASSDRESVGDMRQDEQLAGHSFLDGPSIDQLDW